MRPLSLTALIALALLIPLGGCGGGGSNPPPPCTGSSCPPNSSSDFLYESNTSQVSGFQVDSTTGIVDATLTPVTGPAIGGGLVLSSTNFLYVADSGNNAVDGFSVNTTTGALTSLSGFPVTVESGQGAQGMAVDPSGKFLFVPQHNTNEVAAYTTSSGGQLTLVVGSPFPTGGTFPVQAVVDPSGKFLYVSNSLDPLGRISAFTIDSSSGVLKPVVGSPFTTLINGGPSGMAVHPNGKFLYIGMVGVASPTNQIVVESINTASGALTPIINSPVLTGSEPNGIAIDPTGKYLFSANAGDGTVSAFTVDGASGDLTPIGSPVPAGTQPAFLVVNSTSAVLYVLDAQSTSILTYTIGSTGALTPVAPINGGGGATGLAIVHRPQPL